MTPEIWFPNLDIKINHLNRIAFSIFGLDVYWYGVLIGLGLLLCLLYIDREAKRTNQSSSLYSDFFIYATFVSIIFARIYYVVFSWDYYKDNLSEIFSIRNGGIAIYGAIIGASLTALIYTKRKNLDLFLLADTCLPGLLIGQIVGRFGNFVNREAFGSYTDSIFALRYLKDQISYIPEEVLDKVIEFNGASYIQVHPTFLYEVFWNLGLLTFILLFKKHKKFNGQIMSIYFIGYGIGRFWIEGLRTDSLMTPFFNIRISQALSLILIIILTVFIIYKKRELKNIK